MKDILRREGMPVGPSYGDCYALWHTLTTEYIPGLRIELRPFETINKTVKLELLLVDDSAITVDGFEYENIWARKEFANQLYLITTSQLFDLLIDGYRLIDSFFSLGDAFAPARRPK